MLRREHDLEHRIVGVVTHRHGAAFAAAGLDMPAMLRAREEGRSLAESTPGPGPDAGEAIARLAASSAPLRVVIETTPLAIADGQPAIGHIEAALDAGCDAITANKGPAAFAYRRLRDRAIRAERSFLFEGAVMDGVPIFNLVRDTMPAIAFRGFRGIVNSTTNHILSALENGEAFAPALATDAGGRHRGGRRVAGRRRLGCRREDGRPRQRADGRRPDAARYRSHRHRAGGGRGSSWSAGRRSPAAADRFSGKRPGRSGIGKRSAGGARGGRSARPGPRQGERPDPSHGSPGRRSHPPVGRRPDDDRVCAAERSDYGAEEEPGTGR